MQIRLAIPDIHAVLDRAVAVTTAATKEEFLAKAQDLEGSAAAVSADLLVINGVFQ